MKKIKVAIIGKSGHAQLMRETLNTIDEAELMTVFYHKTVTNESSDIPISNDFNKVKTADCIIISSPTHTHFDYLMQLEDYGGYVLVEKPGCTSAEEQITLLALPENRRKRLRTNYNLRHSQLFESLKKWIGSEALGLTSLFSISTSQGIAFGKNYAGSWRSEIDKSLGVAELVGVHWINLLHLLFQGPKTYTWNYGWKKERHYPPDNVALSGQCNDGTFFQFFHTYAGPYQTNIKLIGTNGIVDYNGTILSLRSPRETRNEKGRFILPPEVSRIEMPQSEMWTLSLKSSLLEFLKVVGKGADFSPIEWDRDIHTMDPVLQLRNHLLKK